MQLRTALLCLLLSLPGLVHAAKVCDGPATASVADGAQADLGEGVGRWAVQVGAYRSLDAAWEVAGGLPIQHPTEVSSHRQKERKLFRVRWGDFGSRAAADRGLATLEKQPGAFVTAVDRGRFEDSLDVAVRVARRASEVGQEAPDCVRVVRQVTESEWTEVGYGAPLVIDLIGGEQPGVHTVELAEECDGQNIYSDLSWMSRMGMRVAGLPAGSAVLECLRRGGTQEACSTP